MSGLIRGITLTHPWAFCIAYAGKDVENRTWRPEKQGGKVGMYLAIHGGVVPTGAKKQEALSEIAYIGTYILTPSYIHHALKTEQLHKVLVGLQDGGEGLFTPGIVAVARLAAVTTDGISPWKADGQYQWELADVVTLAEPVPHKGAQGLWEIEPAALTLVRERWAAARQTMPALASPTERLPVVDTTPALTGQVCGTCANGTPGEYPDTVECLLGWERQDGVLRPVLGGRFEWIPVPQGHGGLPAPIMHPGHSCIAVIGNGHPGWAAQT